ncbi:hypothetical protein [Streptomyces sp. LaPpAH-108]|uniref:hypothetical protein n=1 Tax=Streptomyces sp. LaPpAH-108 TaxID=1155714 RepID=UPI00037CC562|nr:hypothetical protein [Streptomyces sp. LaPpAH-108]
MNMAIRATLVAAALVGAAVAPASAASGSVSAPRAQAQTVRFAGGEAKGLTMAASAPKGTEAILEADPAAAVAAANVCGSGYTISTGAARYGSYGTTYTWWNGASSGSNALYDRPICGVFFNDSGVTRYMGVRLKDNYTATPDTQDFGAYSQYAGPVYQNKGYCGQAYSYMEDANGKVLVDNYLSVGSCD